MDIFEELVMGYLVREGNVFVSPQYQVAGGWSVPDFVALDPAGKKVSIVEVSAAAWPGPLLRKVNERENQWLSKLKKQLQDQGIVSEGWTFEVVVYIRKSAKDRFDKKVRDHRGVSVKSLEEDVGFYWEWDWPSTKARKEAEEAAEQS